MKKIKISVLGMHCASCASNIERSLGKLSGIRSSSVSLITNKAIVEAEESVSESDIKRAIEKAGYRAEGIIKV